VVVAGIMDIMVDIMVDIMAHLEDIMAHLEDEEDSVACLGLKLKIGAVDVKEEKRSK